MRALAKNIMGGERYFGSGGYNSEEFNNFFDRFKRGFKSELKKIQATDIEFSKGHYYLSGFFRIGEQLIYFSLSDVRHGLAPSNHKGIPQMLVRTAEHNKDYSGGGNRYVTIEPNMSKQIAYIFGMLELYSKPKAKQTDRKEIASKLVTKLKENNEAWRSVSSNREASFLAWEIATQLGVSGLSLTEWKRGRAFVKITGEKDGFRVFFDSERKTLSLTYK